MTTEPTGAETRDGFDVIAEYLVLNDYLSPEGLLDALAAAGLTLAPAGVAASDGVTVSRRSLDTALDWATLRDDDEWTVDDGAAVNEIESALEHPATLAGEERPTVTYTDSYFGPATAPDDDGD